MDTMQVSEQASYRNEVEKIVKKLNESVGNQEAMLTVAATLTKMLDTRGGGAAMTIAAVMMVTWKVKKN